MKAPKKILLVALDNLGDLVFASALLPPLRDAFPDAVVDVWCKRYTADVARLIPSVNDVIAADPFWAVRPGHARPPIAPFLRSIGAVRARGYDVAILSEAPWRAAAAVAAARIPMRIGLARRRNSLFLTHVLPVADVHRSVLLEQARLLTALGIESREPRYRLDPTRFAEHRSEIARALPARFAALHPFAASRDRCVPLAEWTQVAFALQSRGLPAFWVGTSEELNELRRLTHPRGYYADEIGNGALLSSAAALSLTSIFVGHDSGPLHIAGAFGVPVVGVFAPGQPDRTFPQGVGPSRMIARPSPEAINASLMLDSIRDLGF